MIDETTELMDERIAQHIVNLHRNPTSVTHAVPFTTEAMQRYIKYARAIKPIISEQVRPRPTPTCTRASPLQLAASLLTNHPCCHVCCPGRCLLPQAALLKLGCAPAPIT